MAYESQPKSDRAELHRRLASVIPSPTTSVDENAALIAEHVQATGDVPGAYGWHIVPLRGWPSGISLVPARAGSARETALRRYQWIIRIAPRWASRHE